MKSNDRVIALVLPAPVMDLNKKFPSIVTVPQTGEVPLGLLYLAGSLEASGFDVIIRDHSLDQTPLEKLAVDLVNAKPLFIGLSVTCLNVHNVRELSRLLKESQPNIPIIVGGPQATLMPQSLAQLKTVDIVLRGQGEISLVKLAKLIREGSWKPESDVSLKIIQGEQPVSLDDISLPARHLLDLSRYRQKSYVMDVTPTHFICSSRGCPFGCAFCSSKTVWNRQYFRRSPAKVVDEIELLMDEYGAKGIYFREDNFSVDPRHVLAICDELIRRKLNIAWECETRVDTISKQTLSRMKEAGCAGVWCGVESGSPRILKTICKEIEVGQVEDFFSWCDELGIPSGACFMLGFPGENSDDIKATFNLAVSLPAKWVTFATYFGFPLSELYEIVEQSGLYEDKWEDVLISRNEFFTSEQLYNIENDLNKKVADILLSRKIANKICRNSHFTFYVIHFLRLLKNINNINRCKSIDKILNAVSNNKYK